ncbi:MAG: substrate-binding domain-containing protein [Rhodanobacter sp.]
MSVRHTCLLFVALAAVCLAGPTFAKSHKGKAKAAVSKAPALIWRGDVASASGVADVVAKAWDKAGHGRIELQPFNTASGIDAVNSGAADIGGSARPSSGSSEDDRLTFTPVAWDGLVLITQAANPVSNLTLKQVHDIYYGKITNWSEVGGNNAPIDVYAVASPGDGVEYSLRDLLFGRGNQPVAAPRLYVNTHKLEEGVALNPNGFGVATLADIRGQSKLKALSINGTPASVANIADGSYVLFTPLYLVTNPRSPKAAQAQEFVDFLQSDAGKAALRASAILPYQDGSALTALNDARRDTILAEVGARPRVRPLISAPGATYAARSAVAPTSPDTQAAKLALDKRNAASEASKAAPAADAAAAVSATNSATATIPPAATTYTVTKGDTLSSIAKKHSTDVAKLRDWNHLKNDKLKLGQVLRVSNN